MSSYSNLKLWRLSIYAAAIAATAGIVGPMEPPAVAQPTLCQAVSGTSLAKVPSVIKTASAKAVAPLKVTQLNDVEVEDGIKIYELGGKQAAGKFYAGCPFEVDIFQNGALDEIEYQVPSFNQVPGIIRTAIQSEVPGYKVTGVEKSVRLGGVVVYETEGILKGQVYEVDAQAKGKNVTVEISKAS